MKTSVHGQFTKIEVSETDEFCAVYVETVK